MPIASRSAATSPSASSAPCASRTTAATIRCRPSLGRFPVRRVADYADRVPAKWREHGGVLLPMYQREAMWLSFSGAHWRPNAVKVAIGKVNAISGEP